MKWILVCLTLVPIVVRGEDPDISGQEKHAREKRRNFNEVIPKFEDYFIKTKPEQLTHDYAKLVENSILFYDAQRSGRLPEDNPIPWRSDSCVKDKAKDGTDLTGGWYDAGDNVKFNFPMAWSTSVLAWGFIEFMDAYKEAGLVDVMLDSIKWPCDYFKKCHPRDTNVYYYQVGNAGVDHKIWGRPEDIDYPREVYKLSGADKGTDVIGLAAAALASCAVAFTEAGKGDQAGSYKREAKELYRIATRKSGCYPARAYYVNRKWEDEQLWAALWVYLATGDKDYLEEAEEFYESKGLWGRSYAFDWGDTREGSKLLLYQITNNTMYKMDVMKFLEASMRYSGFKYTPRGLYFRADWGSLRYSAGASMIALVAAKYGMNPNVYREFACNQTNYMLGDNENHSFVIGYGTNPPCQPHHRASSCPDLGAECTNTNSMQYPGCNHHELTGALVGGPDGSDQWSDNRGNFIQNEVACDYNAPFQGVMAGLHQLKIDGNLPPACYILHTEV